MATQQGVIKSFMKSLDTTSKWGEAALDEAIKACSTFSSFQDLKAAILRDCKNAKNAEDFLKTYCGIDLSNTDTGAITGSDAGGSVAKDAESIIPESGKASYPSGTSFNKRGLKFIIPEKSTLSKDKRQIIQGLYSWWADSVLKLLEESYGYSFNDGDATVKEIEVVFYDTYPQNWYAWVESIDANRDGKTERLTLNFNMKYFNNISDDPNGQGYDKDNPKSKTPYVDLILGHEMTHAMMSTKVKWFPYLPAFVKEGLADLTLGSDNGGQRANVEYLSKNSSALEKALDADKLSDNNPYLYAAGYIFFRYLARQMGDLTITNKTDSVVRTFRGNDNVTSFVSNSFITSGVGNDTVAVGSSAKKVTISSGTGNDFINNWGAQASINTADGNDTIHNSSLASNSYITSGAGNDSILNSGNQVTIASGAGKDTIENHASQVTVGGGADNDFLSNWDWNNKNVSVQGNDGNDTLRNVGSYSTLDAGTGNDSIHSWSNFVVIYGGAGKDTVLNDDYYQKGNNVTIDGGNDDDTILNYGSTVTISGGKGNDKIENHGKNVFFKYASGDGNDVITGFGATDTLSISGGAYSSVNKSGKDLILTVGTGKITLQGAGLISTVNIRGTLLSGTSSTVATPAATTKTQTFTKTSKSPVTLGSSYQNADASKRTTSIKITGNTLANSILGGKGNDSLYGGAGNDSILSNAGNDKLYGDAGNDILKGGAGNDTLTGGAGNDSLWGDPGNDTFIYDGAGKDVIFGFENNDLLQIMSAFIGTYNSSKKEISFAVGTTSNALTLRNFTATSFNINGDAYKISGTKLIKK